MGAFGWWRAGSLLQRGGVWDMASSCTSAAALSAVAVSGWTARSRGRLLLLMLLQVRYTSSTLRPCRPMSLHGVPSVSLYILCRLAAPPGVQITCSRKSLQCAGCMSWTTGTSRQTSVAGHAQLQVCICTRRYHLPKHCFEVKLVYPSVQVGHLDSLFQFHQFY